MISTLSSARARALEINTISLEMSQIEFVSCARGNNDFSKYFYFVLFAGITSQTYHWLHTTPACSTGTAHGTKIKKTNEGNEKSKEILSPENTLCRSWNRATGTSLQLPSQTISANTPLLSRRIVDNSREKSSSFPHHSPCLHQRAEQSRQNKASRLPSGCITFQRYHIDASKE